MNKQSIRNIKNKLLEIFRLIKGLDDEHYTAFVICCIGLLKTLLFISLVV